MVFSVIKPLAIDPQADVTTNITAEPIWSGVTAYTTGDVVARSFKLWQAIQDSTGEKPTAGGLAGTEYWQWIGPTQLEAPFDNSFGVDVPKATETAATRDSSLTFTVTINASASYAADSIALTGVVGAYVEFTYEAHLAVPNTPTGPTGLIFLGTEGQYYGSDFYLPAGCRVTIEITGADTVAVSGIIIGEEAAFDVDLTTLSSDRLQRSVIEDNGYLITFTPRLPGRLVECSYTGAKSVVDSMSATLRQLSNTATMYSHGDDEPEFLVFGLNKRVRHVRLPNDLGEISLDVESIR